MAATPLLLALSGAPFESAVVLALQQPRSGVHIVRRCVDVSDLVATAATGQAQAALVTAGLSQLSVDLVATLRAVGVEPVGVVDSDTVREEQRLHQIGVRVVVSAQSPADIAERISEALSFSASMEELPPTPGTTMPEQVTPGQVIAVWGPTGAPGRSTVALNIAAELADLGAQTLLVDADVYGGSIAQLLAMLDESSGVLAAARSANVGALDAQMLARQCRQLGPSLRILTGLPRADRWPELSAATADAVLRVARSMVACVVVDCGFCLELDEELSFDTAAPRRNGATLHMLASADVVLAVGAADPVGLGRLARAVVDAGTALPGIRLEAVVNRMRPSLGWAELEVVDMVERFTGRRPVAVLPEDRSACDDGLVHGRTLIESAPRSRLRAEVRTLASRLTGVQPPAMPRRRRVRAS